MTTRRDQRRLVDRAKIRDHLKTADRLRDEGHPEAADEILYDPMGWGLGIRERPPADPDLQEARRLMREGKAQQLYDFLNEHGASLAPMFYALLREPSLFDEPGPTLTPEERQTFEAALALTKPEDTNPVQVR